MSVLQADSIVGVISGPNQPSVTLHVTVEGGPWVVKLVCGDTDERRWAPANELVAQGLLDSMGVTGRPEGALVRVPWPNQELARRGAQGPLGFGWAGPPRPDLLGAQIPMVPIGRERDAVTQDLVLRWLGAHVDHDDHNFVDEGGFPMAIDFGGTIHGYGWDSGLESDKPLHLVYGRIRADLICEAMPDLAASLLARATAASDRVATVVDLVPSEWATPEQRANACHALQARLPKVIAHYRAARP